jgi:hypothetical protein
LPRKEIAAVPDASREQLDEAAQAPVMPFRRDAKLYVMLPSDQGSVDSGFWVSGGSFPLPGTQTTRYYLGGSHANSVAGGGTLTLTPACGGFFPSVKQENVGQCSPARLYV